MLGKKLRILWLSDSPTARTGFGVVAKNLIDNICTIMGDRIEIDVVGINLHSEKPIQYNKQTTLYDGERDGDTIDAFCRSFFINILRKDPQGYDGIFILQDFSVVAAMVPYLKEIKADRLRENKKNFKSILYVPVDAYVHKQVLPSDIDLFDTIITYNQYGKEQILRHRPNLKPKLKIIPHGCNQKDFFPISNDEIKAFREEFFGENSGKIIFTNVNRNQPRKDIPSTILSFVEAKKIWNLERKPFLYLHMNRKDPMGHDLDSVFAQTDLVEGEDYMMAPDDFYSIDKEAGKAGCDTAMLNRIYNASDICITTTLGEGYGLSSVESFATRKPFICPYHTSFIDISGNGTRAHLLNELYPYCSHLDNTIREQVNIYETAEVMIRAARQMLDGSDKVMVDKAEAFIRTLDWKGIAKQFVEQFEKTF